jgi:hypothetical protein
MADKVTAEALRAKKKSFIRKQPLFLYKFFSGSKSRM